MMTMTMYFDVVIKGAVISGLVCACAHHPSNPELNYHALLLFDLHSIFVTDTSMIQVWHKYDTSR